MQILKNIDILKNWFKRYHKNFLLGDWDRPLSDLEYVCESCGIVKAEDDMANYDTCLDCLVNQLIYSATVGAVIKGFGNALMRDSAKWLYERTQSEVALQVYELARHNSEVPKKLYDTFYKEHNKYCKV